jgi:hypothetical protein
MRRLAMGQHVIGWWATALLLLVPGVAHAQAEIDRCALATRAEAEGALGLPVAEGTGDSLPSAVGVPGTDCKFLGDAGEVHVTVYLDAGPFEYTRGVIAPAVGDEPQSVAGIGDEAYWLPNARQFWVLKDGLSLSITLVHGPESADAAAALATSVVSRLP